MKSKKSKEINKELDGFEEIIDIFKEDINPSKQSNRKIDKLRPQDNYELYDFLGDEAKRLEKLHLLVTDKLKNLKENPQHDKIIETLLDKKTNLKHKLICQLDEDSLFFKEISKVFNQAFNNSR